MNLLELVEAEKTLGTVAPKEKFWVGVDFDGTLVKQKQFPEVGPPVEKMVNRVKNWLENGCKIKGVKGLVKTVKVFTARASDPKQRQIVSNWTKKYLGQRLQVTNVKDSLCVRIVDNISVRVKQDKGTIQSGFKPKLPDEERQTRVESSSEDETDGTVTRPNNDFTGGGPGSGRRPYATATIMDVLDHHDFSKEKNTESGRSLYKNSSGDKVLTDPRTGMWVHKEKGSDYKKVGIGLRALDQHLARSYGNEKYSEHEEELRLRKPRLVYAGGPGSGRHPWGRKAKQAPSHNRPVKKGETLNKKGWTVDKRRSEAAKKNPVRIAIAEQHVAKDKIQGLVSQSIEGKVYGKDSEPVDVVVRDSKGKLHGIEVKCVMSKSASNAKMQRGSLQQVYMGHGAVPLKQKWAKDNKAQLHTVIVDIRGDKPVVYHASRVGSLTFGDDSRAGAKTVAGGLKGLKGVLLK